MKLVSDFLFACRHENSHFSLKPSTRRIAFFLHHCGMASFSDNASPGSVLCAVRVPVVVPKWRRRGVAAGPLSAAEDMAVSSFLVRLAESIRCLAKERDALKIMSADISRKLKNARKQQRRFKQKASSLTSADLVELLSIRSEESSMSVDSEPTAAGSSCV